MPLKAVVHASAGSSVPGVDGAGTASSCGHLPPVPLLPVANRPLIRHALDWLEEAGIREVAIVCDPEIAREARRADPPRPGRSPETRWIEHAAGGPAGELIPALMDFLRGEPFVLHLADSLSKQGLRSLVGEEPQDGLQTVLVVQRTPADALPRVVDLCARRSAGPEAGAARRCLQGARPAGVMVLGGDVLGAVAAHGAEIGWEPELLAERVRALGGAVSTREATSWWRFGAGAEALLEGNRFALEELRADFDGAQLVDAFVQGAVVAHPTARLDSTVVRGPCIVGPEVVLRDAYIGPYTAIGPNVIVEGAEIEHSVVLDGASIRHLGGRLDASVVGPGARIFRDFRLPRAVRLQVGEGAEVSLA